MRYPLAAFLSHNTLNVCCCVARPPSFWGQGLILGMYLGIAKYEDPIYMTYCGSYCREGSGSGRIGRLRWGWGRSGSGIMLGAGCSIAEADKPQVCSKISQGSLVDCRASYGADIWLGRSERVLRKSLNECRSFFGVHDAGFTGGSSSSLTSFFRSSLSTTTRSVVSVHPS